MWQGSGQKDKLPYMEGNVALWLHSQDLSGEAQEHVYCRALAGLFTQLDIK